MDVAHGRTLQLLHRVVLPLDRLLQAADRSVGCSAAQLSILGLLIYLRVATLSDLAERERISVPTASRIVDAMVRAGLVLRQTDEGDRRVVRLRATERGEQVVELACRAREAALAQAMAGLSEEDWKAVGDAAHALNTLFGYDRVEPASPPVSLQGRRAG